jgi:hypothetical protein
MNPFKSFMVLMFVVGLAIIRSAPNSWFYSGFGICAFAVVSWLEACFKDLENTLIAEIRKTQPKD